VITICWQESNQGPPRRYYAITSAGVKALESLVDQWIRFQSAVDWVPEVGGVRGAVGLSMAAGIEHVRHRRFDLVDWVGLPIDDHGRLLGDRPVRLRGRWNVDWNLPS
jgi:hypothetical protein